MSEAYGPGPTFDVRSFRSSGRPSAGPPPELEDPGALARMPGERHGLTDTAGRTFVSADLVAHHDAAARTARLSRGLQPVSVHVVSVVSRSSPGRFVSSSVDGGLHRSRARRTRLAAGDVRDWSARARPGFPSCHQSIGRAPDLVRKALAAENGKDVRKSGVLFDAHATGCVVGIGW